MFTYVICAGCGHRVLEAPGFCMICGEYHIKYVPQQTEMEEEELPVAA